MVLVVTVWQASAQAPGDEDRHCLNERATANDVYPPSTKMLMDSRNYEKLISGPRPHWQQLNVDGTGTGVGGSHSIKQYFGRSSTIYTKDMNWIIMELAVHVGYVACHYYVKWV